MRRAAQRAAVDGLVEAAGYGDVEEVTRLLMHPDVDVNAYGGEDRKTALYAASERNQLVAMGVLLEQCLKSRGGKVLDVHKGKELGLVQMTANRYSSSRYWRLWRKVKKQKKELAKVKDADDRQHLEGSIEHAAQEMKEVERFQLKRLARIRAAGRGKAPGELLRRKKGEGRKVQRDTLGRSPLCVSCEKGHLDVVRLLLENGASPDRPTLVNGWYPIHFAAKNGHGEVLRLLLNHGAKIDRMRLEDEATALWVAAARGDVKIVKILLEAGASLEARRMYGLSSTGVLGGAAHCGQSAVCVVLLAHAHYMSPTNRMQRSRDVNEALTLAFHAGHWQLAMDLTRDDPIRHALSAFVHGSRALWRWKPHGRRIAVATAAALLGILLSFVMLGPLTTLLCVVGASVDLVRFAVSLPLTFVSLVHTLLAHSLGVVAAIEVELALFFGIVFLRPGWILLGFKVLYAGAVASQNASLMLVNTCVSVHNRIATYLKQPKLQTSVKFEGVPPASNHSKQQ